MNQELFDIYRRNFPFNIRELKTELEILNTHNNYVIEKRNEKDQLIGVSVINENTILLLCVDEQYRKKGIGSELLIQSQNYIKSRGFEIIRFDEGFNYLMPGIPITEDNLSFFSKRGFIHSWGDAECFDMSMKLSDIDYTEKIGDTINGINYRFASILDIEGIKECVIDAEPKFVKYYLDEKLYDNENNQKVLIAAKGNEICGTLIVSIETEAKDVGSVGCTTTKNSFRHQGIASNMVKAGTSYLRDAGLIFGYLGYTYSGLDKLYGTAGYHITTKYMMAQKQLKFLLS